MQKFITKKQEHKIENLGENKNYKVEVMARNKGGNSSPGEKFYCICKPKSKIYAFSNSFIISYHIL